MAIKNCFVNKNYFKLLFSNHNDISSKIVVKTYSKKVSEVNYPKRIFSGIQPTGNVHLGNYLGAIQNWIELQNSQENCIWSIVDMHSITMKQEPEKLREDILKMTATLIACGIDPKKSILFQQSTVPMHAELCWVLGCITTLPRLGHLPQYKEKSKLLKEIPLGLYIYPVLQSADILLYRATHVPVGQDQVQHIQLAQDLAHIFNTKFGETFPIPHSMVTNNAGERIKSLRDPLKKMSKSDNDMKSRIDLIDEPKVILNKLKKAVTDFTSEVTYDAEKRPGVSNLITIHSLLTGKTIDNICRETHDLDTGRYKLLLADVIIETLKPIREEISKLLNEPQYLESTLNQGRNKAIEIAVNSWYDTKNKLGLQINTLCTDERNRKGIKI